MSLFADYIKELHNKEIIEDNRGFATYFFIEQGVYIEDIFVKPEHRHEGVASVYADQIAKIAKEKGISKMFGSVVASRHSSTSSLKVLLSYGFRLESAHNNTIIMVKDI